MPFFGRGQIIPLVSCQAGKAEDAGGSGAGEQQAGGRHLTSLTASTLGSAIPGPELVLREESEIRLRRPN